MYMFSVRHYTAAPVEKMEIVDEIMTLIYKKLYSGRVFLNRFEREMPINFREACIKYYRLPTYVPEIKCSSPIEIALR